ncbi:MAG TPA: carbohydrate-binding family 9-like protein [Candidatus Latescibacteria bacterium]|nr:carbohydrate-binding family 9-like protein [Candidatus Latescibacterota bacterium]HJP29527.1 carbohydrate-binding family 9-like protein [Candidatus Latescibacterota bacterium]
MKAPKLRATTGHLAMVLLCLPVVVAAQAEWDPDYLLSIQPEQYTALRAAGELTIDGALDEPSWQNAPWTAAFVDIEGEVRPRPRFRTRAKMLWDERYFYIAAYLDEPHVWATLTERDAVIFHDNDFEVFIDPDWDTHNYYEYEVNALATEWDLLLVRPYRDGAPAVHEWDIPGLRTGTRVYGTINQPADIDEGWSVEIAFPWEGLRRPTRATVPPGDGDVWQVNFSRVEWEVEPAQDGEGYVKIKEKRGGNWVEKREDNWVWSPQGLINMHFPEQWGFVRFSDQLAGSDADLEFELPPEYPAHRLLREIYWRQRLFRTEEKRYTASLDTLGVAHRIMTDFLWPPRVSVTDYGWEAWVEEVTDLHADGGINRWVITEDSRVVKASRP